MSSWNERPQDLKPEELNAWALTTVADALYNLEAGLQDATREAVSGLKQAVEGLENIGFISISLDHMASALRDLGTGDAATRMGAIEFLATQIREGLSSLAYVIETRTP